MATLALEKPDSTKLGILMIVSATFIMAMQDAIVKLFSADIPIWQLFVLRSAILLPVLFLIFRFSPSEKTSKPITWRWSIMRSALIVLMYITFYASLPIVDLSMVAASFYTGPLFIMIFSAILIGEKVGIKRIFAITLGFIGVLVVLQPGTDAFSWPMVIPIISAISYGFVAVLSRSKCRDESPVVLALVLNYVFIAVGLLCSGLLWAVGLDAQTINLYPFMLGGWVALDLESWGILVILALANLAVHIALAKAYQAAPPTIVATFDYSYLVWAALWAIMLLGEFPTLTTLIGMVLIASAGLITIWRKKITKPYS